MKWISLGLLFFILSLFSQNTSSDYQKMRQGFTYFGSIYQKVADNFVEEIDPLDFIKSGIRGMLMDLDPYTEFFDESNNRRLNLITSGTYGGIGIEIAERPSGIMIMSVVENSPAYRKQIKSGDYITHINHQSVFSKKLPEVSSLLKGNIGEELILKVKNSISLEERVISLAREEIYLKDIPYSGYLNNTVGYIKLSGFSEYAPYEFKSALKNLENEGNLESLVIDLRDNPGGLLESARQIVNLFIPRGEIILSTYGKKEGTTKIYTTEKATYPNIPLVVLINKYSASASEIVAGSLQDLDRAIIIGQQSYGKGLVQKIYTVDPHNNIRVKITTAKYFMPSGRCIQKYPVIKNTKKIQEKIHFTKNGRIVKAGSGITPDVYIDESIESNLIKQLEIKHLIMDFALKDAFLNKLGSPSFLQFKNFLVEAEFEYKPDGIKDLKNLQVIAEKNNYSENLKLNIKKLMKQLHGNQNEVIENQKNVILNRITEIKEKLINGTKGYYKVKLVNESIIKESLSYLKNKTLFDKTLVAGLIQQKKAQ